MPSVTIRAVDAPPAAKAPPPRRAPLWRLFVWPHCMRPVTREQARRLEVSAIDGNCLRPWLLTGDIVLIDRQIEPQPGDLVLCEMVYQRRGSGLGSATLPPVVRMSVKQLREVDGKRFLCAADGAISATPHRVVGVVVGVQRRPSWRRWRVFTAPMQRLKFPVQPCAT
jgi:hypothetical protein